MPGKKKGKGKVQKVLHEYKTGTLKSSSGAKVKSRDQALAIAMSESGMAKNRRKKKNKKN